MLKFNEDAIKKDVEETLALRKDVEDVYKRQSKNEVEVKGSSLHVYFNRPFYPFAGQPDSSFCSYQKHGTCEYSLGIDFAVYCF